MSLVKQFTEMLGVGIGEEFDLYKGDILLTNRSRCKITEDGEIVDALGRYTYLHQKILSGEYIVEKLPWKPKYTEEVWHISAKGSIFHDCFDKNSCVDLALYAIGNCFETKEEAEKNKDKIMKMQKKIIEELK